MFSGSPSEPLCQSPKADKQRRRSKEMGTGWRRARNAFGLHACVSAPSDPDDCSSFVNLNTNLSTEDSSGSLVHNRSNAPTPPRSPSRFHLLRSSMRFSRGVCAICLESMKPGQGHALFTAECSHTFHFPCIASNVKHGNLVCPVCRANWKEVPWQAPIIKRIEKRSGTPERAAGISQSEEAVRYHSPMLRMVESPVVNFGGGRHNFSSEPAVFDDDEPLDWGGPSHNEYGFAEREMRIERGVSGRRDGSLARGLQVTTHPEVRAVALSEERDRYTMLIHVKAPAASKYTNQQRPSISRNRSMVNNPAAALLDPSCRAPLDLVTVLDVSGSMSGTKLALLKQAMGFIIRSLSPADRLSVIAFSSTANRVMPLRRMVEQGRQTALDAVDSLVCTGGTNIGEGLRKGAKVLQDRRERNPVASIMLLSDGESSNNQSNHTILRTGGGGSSSSNRRGGGEQYVAHGSTRYGHVQIPVHAFGLGDANAVPNSKLIKAEEEDNDTSSSTRATVASTRFAQCIGGLLSVVVQDVRVFVCVEEGVCLKSVEGGRIIDCGRKAVVKLGDLYAEEKRDVLLELRLPGWWEEETNPSSNSGGGSNTQKLVKKKGDNTGGGVAAAEMRVIGVHCTYKDPVSQQIVQTPLTHVCVPTPAPLLYCRKRLEETAAN